MNDEIFAEMAKRIIQEQETIIGPVAIEQARQVNGLDIDWDKKAVKISTDPASAIDVLIGKYKELFGQISVDVSREAVAGLASRLPSNNLPKALR